MADKEGYFTDKTQFKDIILSHFGQTNTQLIYKVNAAIVEKIIGEMLFHPDEQEGTSHAEALKLFTLNEDRNYTVTIKNPLQFQLIVYYLVAGLSFRHFVNFVTLTRKLT